jgi:hypothetical protein
MTAFPEEARRFVHAAKWTFARTYAATWPHEYVVQTPENAAMILAIARHIFEHGTEGRFYSASPQVPPREREGVLVDG